MEIRDQLDYLDGIAITELFVPGLLVPILERLGIETVIDLLRLEPGMMRALPGVGGRTLVLLLDLQTLARTRFFHLIWPTADTRLRELYPGKLRTHVLSGMRVPTVAHLLSLSIAHRRLARQRILDIHALIQFMHDWMQKDNEIRGPGLWQRRLEAAAIDLSLPWRTVLKEVQPRMQKVLDRSGIDTMAGIAELLDGKIALYDESGNARGLWQMPMIGGKSIAALQGELHRLIAPGPDTSPFTDERPGSVRALIESMRATQGDRAWTVLELRARGMTLKGIGHQFGVSCERIRQIEAQTLKRLRPRFGALAGEELQDLSAELHGRRLLTKSRALALARADSLQQINVALLVAERPLATEFEGFVSLLRRTELATALKRLRRRLCAQINAAKRHGIELDDLDTMGISMSHAEMLAILRGRVVEIGAGRVRRARRQRRRQSP